MMQKKKRRKKNKTKRKITEDFSKSAKEEKVSQPFSLQRFIKRFKGLFKNIKPYKSGWS